MDFHLTDLEDWQMFWHDLHSERLITCTPPITQRLFHQHILCHNRISTASGDANRLRNEIN